MSNKLYERKNSVAYTVGAQYMANEKNQTAHNAVELWGGLDGT
ncbi:MAG: hypothetical protein Pars2KO_05450 [Parasphingorhabdus sp.]